MMNPVAMPKGGITIFLSVTAVRPSRMRHARTARKPRTALATDISRRKIICNHVTVAGLHSLTRRRSAFEAPRDWLHRLTRELQMNLIDRIKKHHFYCSAGGGLVERSVLRPRVLGFTFVFLASMTAAGASGTNFLDTYKGSPYQAGEESSSLSLGGLGKRHKLGQLKQLCHGCHISFCAFCLDFSLYLG